MPSPLQPLIAELMPTMQRGDLEGFHRIVTGMHAAREHLRPDELTEAVGELAPVLARRPQGVFAMLALSAGALVESGASPVPLAANAPACAIFTMSLRLAFSELWPVVGKGRPEPDPEQPPSMDDLIDLFVAQAELLEVSPREAADIAMSWFDARHWVNLMITLMARREFRAATRLLPDIGAVAEELADRVPRAHWLPGLAQVLDDEPIVAIDQATGRGFRLTMSGIGDNYQLHTLLAYRLIGDPALGLLAGEPPEPACVAAAIDGPLRLSPSTPIRRRFRLFDATGTYLPPEGRPADIALVDGARVVVLHPPRGNYMWDVGRVYAHMTPELTLDRIMTADEAGVWRGRVAPARETDLFAAP